MPSLPEIPAAPRMPVRLGPVARYRVRRLTVIASENIFQSRQKTGVLARTATSHQNRTISVVQDLPGQISHDIMADHAAPLGRTGNDQVIIGLSHFGEDLIDYNAMPDSDLDFYSETFK